MQGLEELNLLNGLRITDSASEFLSFPSTRLGDISRQELYALNPSFPNIVEDDGQITPSTSRQKQQHPTLRKSFRKILQAVSGFRVRMRTVFVPFLLLGSNGNHTEDVKVQEGDAERTVILCVELENSISERPQLGRQHQKSLGFEVDAVDVIISGEGASALLIQGDESVPEGGIRFPLKIGPMEQFNLLYAVTFLKGPEDEMDVISLNEQNVPIEQKADSQRAVALTIIGKPFFKSISPPIASEEQTMLSYPTLPFSSRWNCVLDLSPQQDRDAPALDNDPWNGQRDVLPEPASPFPTATPRTAMTFNIPTTVQFPATPNTAAMAGTMRNTVSENFVATRVRRRQTQTPIISHGSSTASPGLLVPLSTPRINVNLYSPMAPLDSARAPLSAFVSSPTTYALPSAQYLISAGIKLDPEASYAYDNQFAHPITPAYPAYSTIESPVATSPQFQLPVAGHNSSIVGPSVDVRRARSSIPLTPGSRLGMQHAPGRLNAEQERNTIVVSIGLMCRDGKVSQQVKPMEKFTLDVFVFNRSSWARKFELSYPDRKRRQRDSSGRVKSGTFIHEQGLLPMDNHIRIG